MTDREFLELAARALLAAGMEKFHHIDYSGWAVFDDEGYARNWNPLQDDGDCARMEAALGIDVSWSSVYAMADNLQLSDCILAPYSAHNENRQAARRWASTRAAAEIGKAMP